jgi:hypothetical protein
MGDLGGGGDCCGCGVPVLVRALAAFATVLGSGEVLW